MIAQQVFTVKKFLVLLLFLVHHTFASEVRIEKSLPVERYLGGESRSKKSQRSKDDERKNSSKDNNGKNNNGQRFRNYRDDDDANHDDDECVDPQAPFYVENKNISIRCIELNNKSKLFACSWATVKKKCPCKCRKFNDNTSDPDYDDVYKYRDDDNTDQGGGGGGGGGNNSNPNPTPINCSNVKHPFTIFREYEKVLVYCSDLETNEFRFACDRERPRRKCPTSCNVCKPTNSEDDYVENVDNYDGGHECIDVDNQFKVYQNGENIKVGCSDLKDFRNMCRREKVKIKCPVTCGVCSTNANEDDDDDHTTNYVDDYKGTNEEANDDYTTHYIDDYKDDYTYTHNDGSIHDDDIVKFFDGTYDDDIYIVYIDDKTR